MAISDSFMKETNRDIENYVDSEYPWEKTDISVGVDTGMAGIFDYKYYRDDDSVAGYEYYKKDYMCDLVESGEKFYAVCATLTEFDPKLIMACTLPNGVVSNSGWGDGLYKVYTCKYNDKIVGIKIRYMNDKELKLKTWT